MKNKIHIFHIIAILMMGFLCIMYPIWWMDGSLHTTLLKIVTFIPSYGGFFAHLGWYLQNRKYL
jgi:hypothetical protein